MQRFDERVSENLFEAMSVMFKDKEKLKEILKDVVKEELDQKISNYAVGIQDNITYDKKNVNMRELTDFLEETPTIITGQGGLYHNSDKPTPIKKLITTYIDKRKFHKKKMLEAKKNGNHEKEEEENLTQLIYKVQANSLYGIMGLRSSLFFCEDSAKAVTFTGVQLITTSIMAFEKFLGNNIKFNNIYDFMRVVNENITEKKGKSLDLDFNYTLEQVSTDVLKRFENKLSKEDQDNLLVFLANFDQHNLNRIYLMNKYFTLFEHSNFKTRMDSLVNREFKGIDDVNKEQAFQEIWDMIFDYVVDSSIPYDRYSRSKVLIRKAVTVTDTDSTFCSIQPFYDKLEELYGEMNSTEVIWNSNIIIGILTKYIDLVLRKYCIMVGMTDSTDIANINMKSEFLFERVLTTKAKKRYMALMLAQEGVILPESELEMKGINIRKSSVPPEIANFIKTEIVENRIMKSKIVNLIDIAKTIRDFNISIEKEMKEGSMAYYSLDKVNSLSNYQDPTRIMAYRGAVVYETLYKNEPLELPAKFKKIKLVNCSIEAMKEMYKENEDFCNRLDTLERRFKELGLDRFGLDCISVPYFLDETPQEMRPFINTEDLITGIYQNALSEIIIPLGIRHVTYQSSVYTSSLVTL